MPLIVLIHRVVYVFEAIRLGCVFGGAVIDQFALAQLAPTFAISLVRQIESALAALETEDWDDHLKDGVCRGDGGCLLTAIDRSGGN